MLSLLLVVSLLGEQPVDAAYSRGTARAEAGQLFIMLVLPVSMTPDAATQRENWQELSWPSDTNPLIVPGDSPLAAIVRAWARLPDNQPCTVLYSRRQGELFRSLRVGPTNTFDLGEMLQKMRRLDMMPIER